MHTFPCTGRQRQVELCEFQRDQPVLQTGVPDQPGLHREALSQKLKVRMQPSALVHGSITPRKSGAATAKATSLLWDLRPVNLLSLSVISLIF